MEGKLNVAENYYKNVKKVISDKLNRYWDFKFEILSKPISINKTIKDEKEKIKELIKNSGYIEVSKINTNLVISTEAKLKLLVLANDINDEIYHIIESAIPFFIKSFNENIDIAPNYKSLKELIEAKKTTLNSISTSKTVKAFLQNSQEFNVTEKINEQLKYLAFFSQFNLNIVYNINKWSSSLGFIKKQLSKLLEVTHSFNENGTLEIFGIFVNTEQVINIINSGKIQNLKEVHVYVLKTLFLDHNLISKNLHGVNIVIAAPEWKINNKLTIDLSGISAKPYNEIKAQDGLLLEEASDEGNGLPGAPGINGRPGKPGGSAGNFYGFSKNIDGDLQNITIDISGGHGGLGQNGGDGAKGSDSIRDGSWAEAKINNEQIIATRNFKLTSIVSKSYNSNGSIGGNGGDGGKGGLGGESGHLGKVKILNNNNDVSSTLLTIINQEQGSDGSPGRAGIGGKNGSDYYDLRLCTETLTTFESKVSFGAMVIGIAIESGLTVAGIKAGLVSLGILAASSETGRSNAVLIAAGTGAALVGASALYIKYYMDESLITNTIFTDKGRADKGQVPLDTNMIDKELPTPITQPNIDIFKHKFQSYYNAEKEMRDFVNMPDVEDPFSFIPAEIEVVGDN